MSQLIQDQAVKFDFLPHYRGAGLRSIILNLTFPGSGNPVDLTYCKVELNIRVANAKDLGPIVWRFSTEAEDPDSLITTSPEGQITLPEIEKWLIDVGNYKYDLWVTDSFGFPRKYLIGNWIIK